MKLPRVPAGRRLAARIDSLRDSVATGEARQRAQLVLRKIGLTRAGLAALTAAIVVWLAALVVAGRTMYLLSYGLLLGVVVSLLLAPKRVRVVAERAGLYPRASEGTQFEVTLRLVAEKRLSNLVIEEQIPERIGRSVRVAVSRLRSGQALERTYTIRAQRRGVYQIGPLLGITSDPLALATRQTQIAEPFELLVHPRLDALEDSPLTRQFEDPPMRPPVSRPWPSGLEFFGLRDYVPGDDLRRINWRASGRTGTLMVREAEQGITDKVLVILDTDRGGHSRDEAAVSESFEAGVRAAASLGVSYLRKGFEVQVESNAGPMTRPLRGTTSQVALLDAFARAEMTREPLVTLLSRLAANPPRNAHIVLITPRLGPVEAARLRVLARTGASVLVVALLWDEASATIPAIATGLGCQVTALRPGGSVAEAVSHEIAGAQA